MSDTSITVIVRQYRVSVSAPGPQGAAGSGGGGGGGAPTDAQYYVNAANGTLTSEILLNTSNPLPVNKGGTNATTAAAARSSLSAAASGANSDITSLSGLTTPLSVAQGGTAGTTASAARSSLSAAASGANSDITSITGLSTPLAVNQGGTAATTASGARSALSAAASGANSDITSLSALSTPLSVAQGGTGAASLTSAGLVVAHGTSALTSLSGSQAGDVATWDGAAWGAAQPQAGGSAPTDAQYYVAAANGTLSNEVLLNTSNPLAVNTGGTGVTSLSNIVGTTNQVSVSGGTGRVIGGDVTLSLPQSIGTGSSPTFAGLTLTSPLSAGNGGTGVTSLSDVLGTTNQVSVSGGTGRVIGGNVTLSLPQNIHTAATPTFASLTLSSPLTVANGGIGAATLTSAGVLIGNGTSAVTSLTGSSTNDVLTWNGSAWTSAAPSGGGGSTLVGMSGDAEKRVYFGQSHGNANGFDFWGYQDFTKSGTQTHVVDATGGYTDFGTSGAANNTSGWHSNGDTIAQFRHKPVFSAKVNPGSNVTNIRLWIGCSSSTTAQDSSATPTAHLAAFRYDTGTDGTAFWRCVTSDGAGNFTTTTTSVAVSANTAYKMRIDMSDLTSIKFYLSSGASSTPALVATHTTNLPGSTQNCKQLARCTALEAAVKSIGIYRVYIEVV